MILSFRVAFFCCDKKQCSDIPPATAGSFQRTYHEFVVRLSASVVWWKGEKVKRYGCGCVRVGVVLKGARHPLRTPFLCAVCTSPSFPVFSVVVGCCGERFSFPIQNPIKVKLIITVCPAGVGGHPGVFSIFLDRAPGFFLRIFTGNFLDFSENTLPPCRNMFSVFPFRGFFWPFSGFPSFYPHCHGVILKKMGKFLADTRFGPYHQRVA